MTALRRHHLRARAARTAHHASTITARRGPLRRGLTLLELIVVIVILGVLSAIAIPTFISITKHSKVAALEQTASSLADDAAAAAAYTQQGAAATDCCRSRLMIA